MERLPAAVGDLAAAARRVAERGRLAFADACRYVSEGLRAGEIRAVWIDWRDQRSPASPADFTDESLDFDETTPQPPQLLVRTDDGGFSINITDGSRPCLQLNLLDVDRFCDAFFPAAAALDGDPSPEPDRGGRPPVHDWDNAQAQAIARVWNYGLPATKDELTGELLRWFGPNGPNERTVQRKVAKWWPLLQSLPLIGGGALQPGDDGR